MPDAQFVDQAPCGIFCISANGFLTYANSTFARLISYTPDEIKGRKFEDILPVASKIFYQTHFFPLVKMKGSADEIFLSLKSSTGAEVPVLIAAKTSLEDKVLYVHCACLPVYHRRKYEDEILLAKKTAEEALARNTELINTKTALETNRIELDRKIVRLEEMNAELVQFNSFISHDLLEPIRKVMLFTDILRLENKNILNTRSLEMIDRINNASDKMQKLIQNLQYLAGLDREQPMEPVNLEAALEESIKRLKQANPGDPFTIHSDPLPVINGYESQLQDLFYRLLENSVRFKSAERELAIQIRCTKIQGNSYRATEGNYKYVDFLKIVYTDNGIGFDNNYREYIFRILKRVENKGNGLGFGLAFCKKIVQNHGGTITAESDGKGATFTITLSS